MSELTKHLENWLSHTERWRYANGSNEAERQATIQTLRRVILMVKGDVPPCEECLYKKVEYQFDCIGCEKIEVE